MSGFCDHVSRRIASSLSNVQGDGTPMFAVLRSSSSVKVHGQAKIGLDLCLLLKIVLDSCPISLITFTQLSVKAVQKAILDL